MWEKNLLRSHVTLKKNQSQIKILQGEANRCFIYAIVHKKSGHEYLFLRHVYELVCKKKNKQYHFSCEELKIRYFYSCLFPVLIYSNVVLTNLLFC